DKCSSEAVMRGPRLGGDFCDLPSPGLWQKLWRYKCGQELRNGCLWKRSCGRLCKGAICTGWFCVGIELMSICTCYANACCCVMNGLASDTRGVTLILLGLIGPPT